MATSMVSFVRVFWDSALPERRAAAAFCPEVGSAKWGAVRAGGMMYWLVLLAAAAIKHAR